MPGEAALAKKQLYFEKLLELLRNHDQILIVGADNVGSAHMQSIRRDLRGEATLLMGKNTMIRKCIRDNIEEFPELENLLPKIYGNNGMVFCKGDVAETREKLLSNRVGAPAKVGSIAPNSVTVPAGPTGMEPTMTSFLQALNIASKINRGQVEIINDVQLLEEGQKVGQSEATLLQKLNIKPFSYGLTVEWVYDKGEVYSADVLDITESMIMGFFAQTVTSIASVSLATSYPTDAAIPHHLSNAFKDLLAVSMETEFDFDAAEAFKNASAAAPAAGDAAPAAGGSEEPAAAAEPEPEDDESSSGSMGGGLFGDDDGW